MSAPVTGACAHCGAAVEENGSNFVHLATGKHVCSNPSKPGGPWFAEMETEETRDAKLTEHAKLVREDAADEYAAQIAELEEQIPSEDEKCLIRDGHELRAHLAPYLGCTADVSNWRSKTFAEQHPYTVWMDANYPAEQYELAELVLMVYQLNPEHKEVGE